MRPEQAVFCGVLGWAALISLFSVCLTVYDKYAAKKRPRRRVPERVLFIFGALGGAAAMYLTMCLIRHKTKHKSFMIGLPLIFLLHVLLCAVFYVYYIQFF